MNIREEQSNTNHTKQHEKLHTNKYISSYFLVTCCLYLYCSVLLCYFFFFQAEDGIRDSSVTGVQTCALPISSVTGVQTCAFFFSSRRRHTRFKCDWSSDVCSSDLFCL